MTRSYLAKLAAETTKLEQAGLLRVEQSHEGDHRINFTRQDYLGLSDDPRILEAARRALDEAGLGCGSRAFGGTREVHRTLEATLARFLGARDAIVFGSGYLANLALYEALFDSRDCLFCDVLVHPSTAEGVRLSTATVFPVKNADLDDLEDKLRRSRSARFRAIITDGVHAFDGRVAELEGICALAERYEAIVIVDDALGIGVLGETGRGTCELRGVAARVDVVTGTLSKALGSGAGGFVAGRREIVEWLRQKATPYLFSAALTPASAAAAITAVELLERGLAPLDTLRARVAALKEGLADRDFEILGGDHPSFAVRVGGVVLLQKILNGLFERGVRANGICYPVVPQGQARIRLDVSARHSEDDIAHTVRAFDQARP